MKSPKRRITKAIYFYNEDGRRQVMNYSSIGDREVQAWFERMCAMERPPVIKVERGYGYKRHFDMDVMDEAYLRSSAGANGIEVRDYS